MSLVISSLLLAGCQTEEPELDMDMSTSVQAVATSGASYTFPVGSLIIPMDTTYQDQGAFLAYGLVYKLLTNKIPVSWVIENGKRLATIAAAGGASSSGTTATFTTTSGHALSAGARVTVRNVGVAGYNGTWTVANVVSATVFTATIASANLASSGGGTVTPADFVASATDKQGGPAITNHNYRGGPFLIDQPNVAAATPIVDAWQAANPSTKVHVATASVVGFVERQLVAAPTIAQFDDGNADVATRYLNAAKIPDSQGLAWTAASVDLLSPAEVAGPTCVTSTANIAATPGGATSSSTTATFTTTAAHSLGVGYIVTIAGVGVAGYNGTWTVATVPSNTTFTVTTIASGLAASGGGTATMNDCRGTRHDDGALFDANGSPAYCQMMSMHWGIGDAATMLGRAVVLEYRKFLQFPTHLFAECAAVNAIENNTNVSKAIAPSPNGATSSGTTATFTTTVAHLAKIGDSVLVAGVAVAGYNGTWIVTSTPSINQLTATITNSNLAASGGGTVATYNGLFLTTSGYLIGARPPEVDSFNYDQAYAQYDGYFKTTGGSEPSYSIPANGGYKAQDVVMLTQRKAVPATGLNDVWMTGFLDGKCNLTSEFCDPQFAQGKVSYLGGHDYGTMLPISTGDSQGTRLFLNALLEAPCATDLGVASLNLHKTAPTATNGNQATHTITAFNNGASVAGSASITDTLAADVAFVPGASQREISSIARVSNVVTVTTSTTHPFIVNERLIVTGVGNSSFDGTFVITQVVSGTQFRYAQTAGNASSSGGRVALGTDGVCIGTTTQCGGSGGGVVTFALGAIGPGQSTTVSLLVQFQTPAMYSNTAGGTYKAGVTTFVMTSNTTTTCYYAGNPSICTMGGDPDAPVCSNGIDDDGDALIDFPDDPGCNSALDNEETDAPAGGVIKGRVLIVFDTSGSMMWNTCRNDFTGGDGSLSCPGADVACSPSPPGCNTSGCGNGIADDSRMWKVKTGITNVVSGFGEVEWGLMRFKQLPVEFSCGTLNVNKNDGGWQGASGSPCTGFNAGEVAVKFDPQSANSLLGWMDHSTNYPGTPTIGKDFELRATGNTPLAGSLASARTYIAETRSADNAVVAACRPYRVILVTDGAETCAGDPAAQAGLLFAASDSDGTVPVHVIGFSTPDPQTQAQLDQIASQGGTTRFVPADDDAQLSAAIVSIVQSTILVELCNDLDDDCDGKIDEGFPDKGGVCTNGAKGVCHRSGARVCDANGSGTHCDAPAVTCSDLGSCTEICNGLDDDCDGKIDEAPALSCTCVPTSEACNCKDDDCDGTIDEGTLCPSGGTCTSCQCAFPCAGGEFPCLVGQECSVDNFCVLDPCFGKACPTVNGNKQTCIENPSGDPFDHLCVEACSLTTCSSPLICHAPTGECRPDDCSTFPERCAANQSCINGTCMANPCAGVTCQSGQYCLDGGCFGSCADVSCPAGQRCRQGACEADPCGEPCPFGAACNDATGMCLEDLCKFRNCPKGQWCNPNNNGMCEDDPCVINHVVCPDPADVCRGGTCENPARNGAHVTVGGGGGCQTTSGSGLGLGFALLLLMRRRRGDA